MYDIFDGFCKLPTWDKSHALDETRFKSALSEVVHLADFSPEAMGRYVQLNHAEPIWPKAAAQLDEVINRLVDMRRWNRLASAAEFSCVSVV